jgi:prepilin-type N-terminal cleavage/methylation domain-containing protein
VRGTRGLTLLEVVVATAIVAIGVVALERLVVQSTATLAADVETSRALLAAQAVLAEAVVVPPEPGRATLERAGLRVARDVEPTAHPALRQVRVRAWGAAGAPVELLEVVRVPAP